MNENNPNEQGRTEEPAKRGVIKSIIRVIGILLVSAHCFLLFSELGNILVKGILPFWWPTYYNKVSYFLSKGEIISGEISSTIGYFFFAIIGSIFIDISRITKPSSKVNRRRNIKDMVVKAVIRITTIIGGCAIATLVFGAFEQTQEIIAALCMIIFEGIVGGTIYVSCILCKLYNKRDESDESRPGNEHINPWGDDAQSTPETPGPERQLRAKTPEKKSADTKLQRSGDNSDVSLSKEKRKRHSADDTQRNTKRAAAIVSVIVGLLGVTAIVTIVISVKSFVETHPPTGAIDVQDEIDLSTPTPTPTPTPVPVVTLTDAERETQYRIEAQERANAEVVLAISKALERANGESTREVKLVDTDVEDLAALKQISDWLPLRAKWVELGENGDEDGAKNFKYALWLYRKNSYSVALQELIGKAVNASAYQDSTSYANAVYKGAVLEYYGLWSLWDEWTKYKRELAEYNNKDSISSQTDINQALEYFVDKRGELTDTERRVLFAFSTATDTSKDNVANWGKDVLDKLSQPVRKSGYSQRTQAALDRIAEQGRKNAVANAAKREQAELQASIDRIAEQKRAEVSSRSTTGGGD